MFYDTMKVV